MGMLRACGVVTAVLLAGALAWAQMPTTAPATWRRSHGQTTMG